MTNYVCAQLEQSTNIYGGHDCATWVMQQDYSGYKLSNSDMGTFIFAIAALFATVAAIKIIRRTFF